MTRPTARTAETTPAPPQFRDALAELVQIGLKVARMVGQSADAETHLAESAAQATAAENVPAMATSLAEAIEADRAAAAAAEARQTVVARTAAVAIAYARVSRAIRLTILLAERLDTGWARGSVDDRQTMTKRQITRAVEDAIAREAEGEWADDLTVAFTERLESLDREFGNRPTAEIIAMICRDLGLDPARMTTRPPLPAALSPTNASRAAPLNVCARNRPSRRRPDG